MNNWKILVAVDEGPYSDHALDQAVALAKALGADLALAHAVDIRAAIVPDAGIASEEILQAMRESGRAILEKARGKVAGACPEADVMLLEGIVPDEIVGAAKHWGASHIVIGTHGRSGLSRLLMGSTAENVLRHSPVPVIVVPWPKDKAARSHS